MDFLAPPVRRVAGGVLKAGGAALGGPPVEGTLGVELIRTGGILAGFNPDEVGGVIIEGGGAGEVVVG